MAGLLPIDPHEVDSFLRRQKSMQLATLNPDGSPHLATMWFGLIAGSVVLWTQRASRKARNLRRDPRIACLLDEGTDYGGLRGLTINGHAELVEDADGLVEIGAAIIGRNFAGPAQPDYRAMALSGARVGIRVVSEHVASWDFGRSGREKPPA